MSRTFVLDTIGMSSYSVSTAKLSKIIVSWRGNRMDDTASGDQQSPAPSHISPFERIRHLDGEREFWSARDLTDVLGYTQWRNFEQAISRAIRACRTSGQDS